MPRPRWSAPRSSAVRQTRETLDFCAAHGVGAEIEVIEASRVDEAYERVSASGVRHRFVIDTVTI